MSLRHGPYTVADKKTIKCQSTREVNKMHLIVAVISLIGYSYFSRVLCCCIPAEKTVIAMHTIITYFFVVNTCVLYI